MTRCRNFFPILCLALGIIFSGMPAAGAEQMKNSTIVDPGNPENAGLIPAPESLPALMFDDSRAKITISTPLGPSTTGEDDTIMRMQEKTDTDRSAIYQVPKGAIIYHSLEGVTTVFDENGNQIFSADDADAGQVSTPRGDMPATRVRELPSGSTVYPSGNITWVVFNDQIILVDISEMQLPDESPEGIVSADETRKSAMEASSTELPGTDFDPDKVFLERVAIHYSPATREYDIDSSSVQWTVPAAPKITRPSQIQYLEHLRLAEEAYSYHNNKSPYGVSTLYSIVNFDVVSEYNRYPNTWDMSAWIQNFNSSRPTYYSRGISVNTGDVLTGKITGKYKINTTASWNNTESWSATISDQNGQTSKLNLVAEKMEAVYCLNGLPVEYRFEISGDFNVDSESNFIGDTTFSDFQFTDQTGGPLRAGDLPVYYVYVNNWFDGKPEFKDMRIDNKWPVTLFFGTQALPAPVVYTFSMTNTATRADENATKGELMTPAINDCDMMKQKLEARGWIMNFYRKGPEVTKADFNVNPEPGHVTLNSGVLHFHVGHGIPPDSTGHTTLQLLDQNNDPYYLQASEVEGKWGGNNKWVILDSCYALLDNDWGKALGTSHGIMGFKTQADVHPRFTERFLYYANEENKTVYDAFRWTTYDLSANTKVPKFVGNTAENETMIAAVIFKNSDQAKYDYLPGVKTGVYSSTDSGYIYRYNWSCDKIPMDGVK